mmetsp:Transcript_19716/g.59715  ORF Transcript_19716/g.59715 Transcript_19716/m.59715 type:complete len:85 (+) Transcript_19716:433-687(+)|eukprot:CAMPEP_0118887302 /NCGR_PEP_ID=MMETSP1163-20130328/25065_1 /TAXON_ID=124430 /ORGANISM="Phaeomonas parva, Strain CCMP2877" /LENGTH=84 /DNA_ID=CAMNT_0006825707 /DNA_START=361 /DNA_END=615 /DNA_ORIENTATION=-
MHGNQLFGAALVGLSVAGAIYYATWVLLLPFADADEPLLQLFPARKYAIIVPAAACATGLSLLGIFVSAVILKAAARRHWVGFG